MTTFCLRVRNVYFRYASVSISTLTLIVDIDIDVDLDVFFLSGIVEASSSAQTVELLYFILYFYIFDLHKIVPPFGEICFFWLCSIVLLFNCFMVLLFITL